jgi:DNA polymerase III sliding clamp (beta) subunit (PCNA family)
LKSSDTKLEVTTTSSYQDKDLSVDQTREFHLVASHLSINEADKPLQIQIKVKAEYFIEMLHLANRLVSSYTADITSLAGILLRVRNKVLVAVVSDGTRILEIKYPEPIGVDDFELILPKTTATILHGMVDLGNEIEICADSRRIKFYVDNDGLKTYLASSLLKGVFPEYEPIFKSEPRGFEVDTKVLLDNISNIRSSTHDDTYRIRLKFDGKDKIEVTNQKAAGHVGFSNKGIVVRGLGEGKIDALMNALLMEGLLSLIPSEKISLIAPPLDKPIILEGEFNNIKLRAAIALATE